MHYLIYALLLLIPRQTPGQFPLMRYEVIRINPEDIEHVPLSLRPLLVDPVPDGEIVDSLDAAARRAGFTPRLPKPDAFPGLSAKPQFGVTDPVSAQVTIGVLELTTALKEAKVQNVTVPQAWEGAVVRLQQSSGVLSDYGDFFLAQAPPLTFIAPAGFAMDQFLECLLRVAGIGEADARSSRQKFASSPAAFFPIPRRYDMDVHEVKINGNSGLLLQNAEKSGELALIWSDADRSYFLTGLLTEAQAVAVATSIK